jgi:ATP/maltotriose-dependent transcriptional regulator MalT
VVSLDPERTWFRYHQLFGDLLRLELRGTMPEQEPALHRRAAEWFSEHGEVVGAIRHTQAAGDWHHAARLLTEHSFSLALDGHAQTMQALVRAFPPGASADPELALVRATGELVQGHLNEAAAHLIETGNRDADRWGDGAGLTFVQLATAVLANGRGCYEVALAAARQASEDSPVQWFSIWALAELIEAASRTGVPEEAADAVRRLAEIARASGTDWVLGIEARSRALISRDESAEMLYREAIGRLGRTRLRVELGRCHLLYGEWLRRENRRVDAREQLRTAYEMLAAKGADGFAERAVRELRASGERVRSRVRTIDPPARLTERESQIARLASDGQSNAEIATELFLSPGTVEYHLHKIFTKLAISNRNQLHGVLIGSLAYSRAAPSGS